MQRAAAGNRFGPSVCPPDSTSRRTPSRLWFRHQHRRGALPDNDLRSRLLCGGNGLFTTFAFSTRFRPALSDGLELGGGGFGGDRLRSVRLLQQRRIRPEVRMPTIHSLNTRIGFGELHAVRAGANRWGGSRLTLLSLSVPLPLWGKGLGSTALPLSLRPDALLLVRPSLTMHILTVDQCAIPGLGVLVAHRLSFALIPPLPQAVMHHQGGIHMQHQPATSIPPYAYAA